MATQTDIANRIAKCAIDHYDNNIPSNGGKPQIGREGTVYAAIVACRKNSSISINNDDVDDMWVVSCATGSKCTSIHSVVSSLPASNSGNMDDDSICQCYKGMVLKDSHAEALCRRGFVASLWNEIENYLQQYTNNNTSSEEVTNTRHLLEVCNNNTDDLTTFKLKSNITLHMYISDSPCGDATIYEIRRQLSDKGKKSEETELNFTGAKLILSDTNRKNDSIISTLTCSLDTGDNSKQSTITLGREDSQQLGALRLKSSRSNISNRSTSMSCSDKLVRWGVFGLQGTLLSTYYIPEPIILSSVYVSKDPRSIGKGRMPNDSQLSALERALPKRIESALQKKQKSHDNKLVPPVVSVVDVIFESSKSVADYQFDQQNSNERKRKLDHTDTDPRKRAKTDHTSPDSQTLKSIHKSKPACGMSINWHQTHLQEHKSGNKHNDKVATTEITVGATGLKRGKKPKQPRDVLGSASRLCRFNLLQRCLRCTDLSSSQFSSKEDITSAKTYMQYKKKCSKYAGTECFRGPLAGYIRSGKEDDFQILSSIDKDSN